MLPSNKTLYVRASSLIGMDRFFEDHGLDGAEELVEVGIDASALADFTQIISFDALNKLMLNLAKKTGVESIGADLALRAPRTLDNIGPLALVLKLGNTTGECVQNALKYVDYLTNGLDVCIIEHPEKQLAEFRYTTFPPVMNTRHLVEHALITARSAMALLLQDETILPKRVTFRHAAPRDMSALAQHFGCPIEYDAETNSMFVDQELLFVETSGTDEQVSQIVYSHLEAEIQKLSEDLSTEQLVETAILQLLPSGHCSMDLVSKAIGTHPKNLQRQLRDEGTTYSDILQRKRIQTAEQLLEETNMPIKRISKSCGYSTATAFNLAFKNWMHMSPVAYRQSKR